MGFWGEAIGLQVRSDTTSGEVEPSGPDSPSVTPPAGERTGRVRAVSANEALGVSMVYRAVSIHTIAAKQMSIRLWRENLQNGDLDPLPLTSFIRRPDPNCARSAWVEMNVASLALTGNAYWEITRDTKKNVTSAVVLNPHAVRPVEVAGKPGVIHHYDYAGRELLPTAVKHLKLLRVPGEVKGLGPIQAAQTELRGSLDLVDYSSNWFANGDVPTGVLSSDMVLSPDIAKQAKAQWKDSLGGKRDLAVLGSGLKYVPIFLSPADAQFLESRQFDTTTIARMFGTPASLMLATVEGGSQTYSNVEQDWLGFVRFSNMQYLIEIEDALSDLLPAAQRAKFNVEALLRADTTTRYAAHKVGIDAGFLDVDEVRKIENLPARQTPAPAATPKGTE